MKKAYGSLANGTKLLAININPALLKPETVKKKAKNQDFIWFSLFFSKLEFS